MDNLELSYSLLPYILSLAISLGVALYAWRRRKVRGAYPYGWVAFGQAIWTFGYIIELASPSLAAKHFWDDFQWLGALIAITAFPVAILEYAGIGNKTPQRLWGMFAIVPSIFLLFLVAPGLHAFIHGEQQLIPGEPFSILFYEFTPLVWGITAYIYGIYLAILVVLVFKFINPHRLYRTQVGIIMIGVLVPLIGVGFTMAGVNFYPQRDISPLTSAVQNLMIAWGLFHYGLFDVVPIARDSLIDNMSDLVVVLDARDRIVDINFSALRAIDRMSSQVIGRPAEQVFANFPELIREFAEPSDKVIEITLPADGKIEHYEVKATRLFNVDGDFIGRIFVSRDITLHVELQNNLAGLNNELEQRVRQRTEELEQAYNTTLEGWARALELRDKETAGHSRRVIEMTLDLARALGVPDDELEHIRRGAILHDIGKMAVPDDVLRKPGPLTKEEWEIVTRHPTIAYNLLDRIPFLQKALDIPYCHHEKWDGSGYPRGLRGKEIPLAARIFTVVDVWDAIQSDRPYKDGWSYDQAMDYIRRQAGVTLDPEIVATFLGMVEQGRR